MFSPRPQMRVWSFIAGLLLALALAPGIASAASGETLPFDVQCWRSIGLTEGPPPGQLAALVEQCVQTLEFAEAAREVQEERELRRKALLERARMQATFLTRVRRGVVPPIAHIVPAPAPQRLPSLDVRRSAINHARILLTRRRQWTALSEELRTQALLADRAGTRACLSRTDILLDKCIRQIAESARHPEIPSAFHAEYVGQAQVTLSVNKSAVTDDGVTIQLLRIIGDSRCMEGVACLWAGEAAVSARIFSQQMVEHTGNLTLQVPRSLVIPRTEQNALAPPTAANTVTIGRCTVAFARLLPFPRTEFSRVVEEQYTATFVVLNPHGYFSCAP